MRKKFFETIKFLKNENGYSIIEIAMGIAIALILVSMIITNFKAISTEAKVLKCNSALSQMATQIEAYSISEGSFPATLNDLVTDKRMNAVPNNPFNKKNDNTGWTYTPNDATGEFTLKAAFYPSALVEEVTTGEGTAQLPQYRRKAKTTTK